MTQMNIFMKQKQTHRHREQTCCCQGGCGGGGMDWESGISGSKLLYREWIKSKILLYSSGNYIQYNVINHNGKEKFKVYTRTHTYIYITESLCYTAKINTAFEISYSSTKFLKIK